jgi:pimeloyl-ACP methyl ester carboxylesterase
MRWESLGEEVPRCVATGQSGFDPRVGHVDLRMTPEAGRFLLHILPSGFMRLWHYGFVVHWRQEVTSSGGQGGSSFPFHDYDIANMTLEERADFWVHCCDSRISQPRGQETHPEVYQQQHQTYLEVFQLGATNPERNVWSERQIHARKLHNTYERLPQLTMPTYICSGRYDKIAPLANQCALLQQIPNARLTLFNGSHMLL